VSKYLPGVRRVDVLIASPRDAKPGRDAIEQALHEWNDRRAHDTNVMLRPRRYEMSAVPLLGRGDSQTVINRQLVDSSEIIFAIFYHRLGSATARAISGTAEEIERAVSGGKLVHVYFGEKNLPYNADLDQFYAVRAFRKELEKLGLVATFKTETTLRDEVSKALEYDIADLISRSRPMT
jgi:hypothetical protein